MKCLQYSKLHTEGDKAGYEELATIFANKWGPHFTNAGVCEKIQKFIYKILIS